MRDYEGRALRRYVKRRVKMLKDAILCGGAGSEILQAVMTASAHP